MKGKVNKFCVDLYPLSNNDESKDKGDNPGIFCNECMKACSGFRYKCITCPNYNLCNECEFKGQHPLHYMIRIPFAQDAWPQHLFWSLQKIFNSSSDNCSCCEGLDDDSTKSSNHLNETKESIEDSKPFNDEHCGQVSIFPNIL